ARPIFPVGGPFRSVARKSHPPEWAFAFTKQRTNVLGYKARYFERVSTTRIKRLLPDVVAVVEGHGTCSLQRQHRLDVFRHRLGRTLHITLGIRLTHLF